MWHLRFDEIHKGLKNYIRGKIKLEKRIGSIAVGWSGEGRKSTFGTRMSREDLTEKVIFEDRSEGRE